MEVDVLEILKIGFSGFAFLLAFLAYRLLFTEQKREVPRENQLNAISRFMGFSIILGIMTAVIPFIPKLLEEKPNLFMEAMLQSAKDRKPLPAEFIQNQILELSVAHNQRMNLLYLQRGEQESKLKSGINTNNDVREVERSIRRIEQYIRQENRDYGSKISDFRGCYKC